MSDLLRRLRRLERAQQEREPRQGRVVCTTVRSGFEEVDEALALAGAGVEVQPRDLVIRRIIVGRTPNDPMPGFTPTAKVHGTALLA